MRKALNQLLFINNLFILFLRFACSIFKRCFHFKSLSNYLVYWVGCVPRLWPSPSLSPDCHFFNISLSFQSVYHIYPLGIGTHYLNVLTILVQKFEMVHSSTS